MKDFTKLSEIERESNKVKSKKEPSLDIDLGSDTFFMHFSFYPKVHLGGGTFFVCNVGFYFQPCNVDTF